MRIMFVNMFHNGDCFIPKGWMQDMISKLPEIDFFYTHIQNRDILKDLKAEFVEPNRIGFAGQLNHTPVMMSPEGDTIAIQTWCGVFREKHCGEIIPPFGHSTFERQHRIYKKICEILRDNTNVIITPSENPIDYIPSVDWSCFELSAANEFLQTVNGKDLILFCNNDVKSGQSDVGDMTNVINVLCYLYPEKVFLSTKKLNLEIDNLFYTNDIFNKPFDLNDIGYLSKYCKLIVGKNSGPHIFTQHKENMLDSSKTFFCLGHCEDDNLPYGIDLPAKTKFTTKSEDKELIELFRECI